MRMAELVVDLEYVEKLLKDNKLIFSEAVERAETEGDIITLMFSKEPLTTAIIDEIRKTTIPNKRGEYNNIDFAVCSGWSKGKGVGKSSTLMRLKEIEDEDILKTGFDPEQVFFTVPEKLEYLNQHSDKETPCFLGLDEDIDLIGASSVADIRRMARQDTITRIRGYNNGYASPDATKRYPYDYVLEVIAKDERNEVNLCAVKTKTGYILGSAIFSLPSDKVWKQYQKKKRAFEMDMAKQNVVGFKVGELFKELEKRFELSKIYEAQQKYYNEMALYKLDPKGNIKPVKPQPALTEKLLKNFIWLTRREITTTEVELYSTAILHIILPKYVTTGKIDDSFMDNISYIQRGA